MTLIDLERRNVKDQNFPVDFRNYARIPFDLERPKFTSNTSGGGVHF